MTSHMSIVTGSVMHAVIANHLNPPDELSVVFHVGDMTDGTNTLPCTKWEMIYSKDITSLVNQYEQCQNCFVVFFQPL